MATVSEGLRRTFLAAPAAAPDVRRSPFFFCVRFIRAEPSTVAKAIKLYNNIDAHGVVIRPGFEVVTIDVTP